MWHNSFYKIFGYLFIIIIFFLVTHNTPMYLWFYLKILLTNTIKFMKTVCFISNKFFILRWTSKYTKTKTTLIFGMPKVFIKAAM